VVRNKGHRAFAAFWEWTSAHETPRERQARHWVTGGVHGRVLEIGVGVGSNWRYLPEGVAYTGIEPDPFMLSRARRNLGEQGRDLELQEAAAEDLPFAEASFDSVFSTLTLCSVNDLARSLSEVRRVLKPGGQFRYWEHLRPTGGVSGSFLDAVTPVWRRIGAGCHPNRRTENAITAAGFEIRESLRVRAPIPMRVGVAVTAGLEEGTA
jgi:ubiquinone/menaquinone biosynthesis C-methylase UbiE